MSKLNQPRQLEVTWDKPEAFALKIEEAQDGERIQTENQRRINLQVEAEKLQLKLST